MQSTGLSFEAWRVGSPWRILGPVPITTVLSSCWSSPGSCTAGAAVSPWVSLGEPQLLGGDDCSCLCLGPAPSSPGLSVDTPAFSTATPALMLLLASGAHLCPSILSPRARRAARAPGCLAAPCLIKVILCFPNPCTSAQVPM